METVHVKFMISINAICFSIRKSNYVTTCSLLVAPSGGPQSLRGVETTSMDVTIVWDAVNCIERNSIITGYVIQFTPPSSSGNNSVMVAGTGDAGGMVTIDGLTPSTQYSIQVAAVNSDGHVGVFSTILSVQTALLDSKYLQISYSAFSISAAFSFHSLPN